MKSGLGDRDKADEEPETQDMKILRNTPCLAFTVPFLVLMSACGGGGEPDPPAVPTATTSSVIPSPDSAVVSGIVDPNGLATDAWFEYGPDNSFATFTKTADQPIPPGTEPVSIRSTLNGLDPGVTYYYRVVAESEAGTSIGTIRSFATPLPAPAGETGEASNLTATGATLNGTVNPNGQAGTVWFEWGEAPELAAFSTTPTQPLSAGTVNQAVSADLVGLTPGTTYYYRVAATTAGGEAVGAIESFSTQLLPTATTLLATEIEVTEPMAEATLRGVVNPNGTVTRAWFEWGTDPTLSTFDSTTEQFLGSGTDNQAVVETIPGLAAWSAYYFRVAAETGTGTGTVIVRGEIASFSAGEYYVAAGDSITRGSHDTVPDDDTSLDGRNNGGGFEPILNNLLTSAKAQLPHTVENEGVSGANSATGLAGIGDVLARHPEAKYFLVMYGTNDAGLGMASGRGLEPGDAGYANSYKDNMRQIIWAIEGAGKRPLLAKVPYTSDPLRDLALIQEYNDVVDELVAFHFIDVVPPDFFAHFQSNPGELDDGTHPDGVGYQSMAALWRDALTP